MVILAVGRSDFRWDGAAQRQKTGAMHRFFWDVEFLIA
tara:strand:- start:62985 stop:63098 length:114 start_codon:yes stop_codon:yes gene_type:complete